MPPCVWGTIGGGSLAWFDLNPIILSNWGCKAKTSRGAQLLTS